MVMREERVSRERGGVITEDAIYVDVNGERVSGPNDRNVHAQAYAAGAMVPKEDAKRYGLARNTEHPADARERKGDSQSFVDAVDHRRAIAENARLQDRLNDAADELDTLNQRIAKQEEEIAMLKDAAGKETKLSPSPTNTTTITSTGTSVAPSTTAPKGANKPTGTPATTETKEAE